MIEEGKDLFPKDMELEKGDKQARTIQTRSEKRTVSHASALAPAPIWAPSMTVDEHTVTANASIMGFDSGTPVCVADALEQALLLPEDMHELRQMRDQNVFMTLKRSSP